MRYVFAKAYMYLCNVYVSMQYLKINTCKGLNIFICFYARLLVWHTMLTKQNNIKLYMQQNKALIYMQRLIKAMQRLYYVYVLLYALIDLYVYGFT